MSNRDANIFDSKEVLLKVITLTVNENGSQDEHLGLIESISKATNQQSRVNEADRRSNDQIQIDLQRHLFNVHGVFYERKRGEYADGLRAGYIERSEIVDREIFLRMCKCCDMEPASARRMSLDQLFERQHFEKTLADPNRFEEYYFAYRCFELLKQKKTLIARDKSDKFGISRYGNGLQFGMYAIISVCRLRGLAAGYSKSHPGEMLDSVLSEWTAFERFAVNQASNREYFREYSDPETGAKIQDMNFNNYYKGRTLSRDIEEYFSTQIQNEPRFTI